MENKESALIIALKLTIICFVSVFLLSLINLATETQIKRNKEKAEEDAMIFLLPNVKKFSEKIDFKTIDDNLKKTIYYFKAYNNSSDLIGYIISSQGKGYGGKMKVMVALDNQFKILNIKLLDNAETPGLGKKAESEQYMNKFIGTNTLEKPLPLNKNMLSQADKDSVTGATITFNGVVGSIKDAIDLLKKEL